jgi:hypothetical protein
MSFHGFVNTSPKKLNPSIIIIDEVQNIYNQKGLFFKRLKHFIDSKDCPIVIMSGTPIFDNATEINSIFSLMRIDHDGEITPEIIKDKLAGKVSYFPGAPDMTFPKVSMKIPKLLMSKHQSAAYSSNIQRELNKSGNIKESIADNNFYIKSRQNANVVFKNNIKGNQGLALLKSLNNIPTYSTKMAYVMPKLKNKLTMIYTTFTNEYGVLFITKVLDMMGFSNMKSTGTGKKRYAIWSGEESKVYKNKVQKTFNDPNNNKAELLQIIIGTPSIKEGVSLFRARQMFVFETYWNMPRLFQIFGRCNRYCSHKMLPKEDRKLTIHLLCSCSKNTKDKSPNNSIDLYMLDLAKKKLAETEPYIQAMMDCAVDKLVY